MREYKLKIKFSKNLSKWGELIPNNNKENDYLIRIDSTAPVIKQVGTLIHEFTHLIFYMFLAPEAIDEKREHRVCNTLDRSAQRQFSRYLEGK